VKCNHAILVVNVKRIHVVSAQRRIGPAQPDQILGKAQMIRPRSVGSWIQAGPTGSDSVR
jgi:hypothetical protein